MIARFVLENPDEMEATIKITLKVGEWRELSDQIRSQPNNAYPSWRLANAIDDVVTQARKVFYAEEKDV